MEPNLSHTRSRASSFIRGVLAVLAIVLSGSGWAAEGLSTEMARAATGTLMEGARQGDLLVLKAAIAEGAEVNFRGTNGLTPLLQTLAGSTKPLDSGRRECIVFLLGRGANVDAKDPDGRTALIHATRAGDFETVRLLVEAHAFILERDRFHKTALLYAAEGHREILNYLGRTLKAEQGAAW